MLLNRDVNIDEFIKVTAGGIQIADYNQIQTALVKRYKEIYGSDIDVSNVTADGIFINNLALIINNILQTFKVAYSNLNIETASGTYLDILCKLSNIIRKGPTSSSAQLEISSDTTTTLSSGTIFVDNIGNEWTYNGQDIQITGGANPITIIVSCEEVGPIPAVAGSITQTLEVTGLTVSQPNDASLGSYQETDNELRERRSQSNGAQGNTVLESLIGALLNVNGIEDAQVINNNTDSNSTATDTSTIKAHSIYVILRYRDNLTIDENEIGNIIFNKLTPGIATNQFTGNSSNGESKSITIQPDPNTTLLNRTVYWKKAKAIHPTCSVVITKTHIFANTTIDLIKEAVMNYLNNLALSKEPTLNDMIITATYADPTFHGASTYAVSSVTLPTSGTNLNTYYNYTNTNVVEAGDNITITFS